MDGLMTHLPETHAVRSARHRPHPTTDPVSRNDVGIYTRTHLHLSDPLAGAENVGLVVERHATHQHARDTLLHETDPEARAAALADAYEIFVDGARLGSVHETATFALADLWTNGHTDALREALHLVDRNCTQHLQDGELWHAAKLARLGTLLSDYAPEQTAWESRWTTILDQKGTLAGTLSQRRQREHAALHNPTHRCARCDPAMMRNALWRAPYTRAPAALRSK